MSELILQDLFPIDPLTIASLTPAMSHPGAQGQMPRLRPRLGFLSIGHCTETKKSEIGTQVKEIEPGEKTGFFDLGLDSNRPFPSLIPITWTWVG